VSRLRWDVGTVINAQSTFIACPAPASGPDSEIVIVFTDAPGTKAALAAADRLVHGLDLRLTLISPRIVPYPLPLECPPVPVEFLKGEMVELARGLDAEITIHILLCRDRNEAVRRALRPESLVVMGTGNIRSRFDHRTLVRLLRAEGLRLILVH
jgi:hypothetical protein